MPVLIPTAVSQNATTETAVERRIRVLEQTVAGLENLLRARTDVGGPEDRTSRDFNLNSRLNDIERTVQQLGFELSTLERQISDASRVANQAQNDARMAQQMARDAAMRIN